MAAWDWAEGRVEAAGAEARWQVRPVERKEAAKLAAEGVEVWAMVEEAAAQMEMAMQEEVAMAGVRLGEEAMGQGAVAVMEVA